MKLPGGAVDRVEAGDRVGAVGGSNAIIFLSSLALSLRRAF